MAAPNIVNVTTITANAAYIVANNSIMSGVLTNTAGSNAVIKVNSVLVTNYGANSITANVDVLRGASSYLLAGGVSVPGNSTLVALAKDIILYLVEGDTLRANVSANTAHVTASYETIS
jgi:hypothetical protein